MKTSQAQPGTLFHKQKLKNPIITQQNLNQLSNSLDYLETRIERLKI